MPMAAAWSRMLGMTTPASKLGAKIMKKTKTTISAAKTNTCCSDDLRICCTRDGSAGGGLGWRCQCSRCVLLFS